MVNGLLGQKKYQRRYGESISTAWIITAVRRLQEKKKDAGLSVIASFK
jgi:hypothetical protein